MRTWWLPVVLLALVATVPSADALSVDVSVPGPVPVDGTPFDARVRVAAADRPAVELKVWLGGGGWQASRTHNGTTFQRSDLYALDVDTSNGSWAGWVPLRANPDSSNADRLRRADQAMVGARVRAGDATATGEADVGLLEDPRPRLVQLGPGASVRAVDGGLVAHRSNPDAEPTVVRLVLPSGFDGRVCPGAGGCSSAGTLVLDRVSSGIVRVRNAGQEALSLSTGVAVLEEGACGLTGSLGSGATRTFALPADADARSEAREAQPEPCAGTGPADGLDARTLWWRGRRVDRAPDPPGWGDAVREPWGEHRWAPWRLPAGVEPTPFRMREVEGAVTAFGTERAGLDRVLEVIEGARRRLTVATYLFTNGIVADALEGAARRGVAVTLVLEPSPVGGMPASEQRIVDRLEGAGVRVRFFDGPIAEHGLQHAKVMVADGAVALVLTENFTMNGLPPDGDGNVGMGVGVANASLAGRVEALFGERGPRPARPWTPEGWRAFDGRVGLLSSPENAWRRDAVPAWLERGGGRVDGLILRADPDWGPRPNAWLAALAEASRERPVRVLATGVPEEARPDNRLALSYLVGHPRAGRVDARLAAPGLGTVHAKALIGSAMGAAAGTGAGTGTVVVGSTNWGLGGVLLNREVNLVVEDPASARRLGEVFDRAWNGTEPAGVLGAVRVVKSVPSPGPSLVVLGLLPAVALAAAASWARRGLAEPTRPKRRRSRRSRRPRSRGRAR